jgi:polar amino acid transport system permease protein
MAGPKLPPSSSAIADPTIAADRRRPPATVIAAFVLACVIASLFVSDWPLRLPGLAEHETFQRYFPTLVGGLGVTLTLVGLSIPLGSLLALPIAAARMSRRRWPARLAYGFVYFFRGTPLLAQSFLVYYGAGTFATELRAIGLWGVFQDAFTCLLITFTLNTAAYQAEILRGAILAVPRGQHEGAAALGLSARVTFFKVILPQALVTALRPYGNEIILMIKGSAVAALVTVFDLMGATKLAFSRSYEFEVYLWAACLYLVLVETLRNLWDYLESRLTRHLTR